MTFPGQCPRCFVGPGDSDIAVGNVVGSSIFNILSVLGLSSLAAPAGIVVSEAVLGFDLPVMIAVACLPIVFTCNCRGRLEGALFLAYYVAYGGCLVLATTRDDAPDFLSPALIYLALPLPWSFCSSPRCASFVLAASARMRRTVQHAEYLNRRSRLSCNALNATRN